MCFLISRGFIINNSVNTLMEITILCILVDFIIDIFLVSSFIIFNNSMTEAELNEEVSTHHYVNYCNLISNLLNHNSNISFHDLTENKYFLKLNNIR